MTGKLTIISWSEARSSVAERNPYLVEVIDKIDPGADYPLLQATYPFGTYILRKGRIHLPDGKFSTNTVDNHVFPSEVCALINYANVPLGMITKNSVEIFYDDKSKIFPVAYYNRDLQIGVWESIGCATPYDITAGARSLYMLPKISIIGCHKRLKTHYGIKQSAPKTLYSQWQVFREIAQSSTFSSPWDCEILFFTKKWADKIFSDDLVWQSLRNYILQRAVRHSALGRKKVGFAFMWQVLSDELKNAGLKPDPYILDTLQHLLLMATGELPGSIPYLGDNCAGPLTEIQKIYVNTYGLKDYVPTIMQPHHFALDSSRPVYYSLQTPTLLNSSPKNKVNNSNIDDIRDMFEIISLIRQTTFNDLLQVEGVNIQQLINSINLDFYHNPLYAYGENIRPTSEMPNDDPVFMTTPAKSNKTFAASASYLRGCVKISKKNGGG